MNPSDFNSYLSNIQAVNSAVPTTQTAQPQQQPTQAPQQSSGGGLLHGLESLIPAGTGILGGLLGTFAGPVGSIGGAAGGAAIGQGIENALQHKSVIQGNDLSSAAENGLGEAVGLGVGKAVGALGEGLTDAGTKMATKTASDAEGAQASAKAVNDAEATKLNYGGINENMQKSLKLGDSQKFMQTMGFDPTNPEEMQKVSQAGEDLNNVYDAALQNAKPVDMTDIGKTLGATQTSTDALTQAEQAALKKQGITPELTAQGTISGGTEGVPATYQGLDRNSPIGQALSEYNRTRGAQPLATLDDQMPATEVRKLQQSVGRQIGQVQKTVNSAAMNGDYKTDLRGDLSDLSDLYSTLGDKIKTPEVNDAIATQKLGDADVQGLKAKYGDNLGQFVADKINNAKSADDLLGPMQDFTRMGQASDMALEDINQVTAGPRATAREKFAQTGGIAPSSAKSNTSQVMDLAEQGAKAVHQPTEAVISLAKKAHEAGVTPKVLKGLGNVMARTAPLVAPASVLNSNIPNIESSMATGSAVPSTAEGGSMQPTAATAGAGVGANPINSVLSTLLAQEQAAPTVLGPSLAPVLQSLAPAVQKQDQTAEIAGALPQTFANAGGAQGPVGGLISSLLSHVPGTAQNTYSREQQAAAASLAQGLGISPQAALALLPQMSQLPGVAAPQQQQVGGIVGQLTAGMPTQ